MQRNTSAVQSELIGNLQKQARCNDIYWLSCFLATPPTGCQSMGEIVLLKLFPWPRGCRGSCGSPGLRKGSLEAVCVCKQVECLPVEHWQTIYGWCCLLGPAPRQSRPPRAPLTESSRTWGSRWKETNDVYVQKPQYMHTTFYLFIFLFMYKRYVEKQSETEMEVSKTESEMQGRKKIRMLS